MRSPSTLMRSPSTLMRSPSTLMRSPTKGSLRRTGTSRVAPMQMNRDGDECITKAQAAASCASSKKVAQTGSKWKQEPEEEQWVAATTMQKPSMNAVALAALMGVKLPQAAAPEAEEPDQPRGFSVPENAQPGFIKIAAPEQAAEQASPAPQVVSLKTLALSAKVSSGRIDRRQLLNDMKEMRTQLTQKRLEEEKRLKTLKASTQALGIIGHLKKESAKGSPNRSRVKCSSTRSSAADLALEEGISVPSAGKVAILSGHESLQDLSAMGSTRRLARREVLSEMKNKKKQIRRIFRPHRMRRKIGKWESGAYAFCERLWETTRTEHTMVYLIKPPDDEDALKPTQMVQCFWTTIAIELFVICFIHNDTSSSTAAPPPSGGRGAGRRGGGGGAVQTDTSSSSGLSASTFAISPITAITQGIIASLITMLVLSFVCYAFRWGNSRIVKDSPLSKLRRFLHKCCSKNARQKARDEEKAKKAREANEPIPEGMKAVEVSILTQEGQLCLYAGWIVCPGFNLLAHCFCRKKQRVFVPDPDNPAPDREVRAAPGMTTTTATTATAAAKLMRRQRTHKIEPAPLGDVTEDDSQPSSGGAVTPEEEAPEVKADDDLELAGRTSAKRRGAFTDQDQSWRNSWVVAADHSNETTVESFDPKGVESATKLQALMRGRRIRAHLQASRAAHMMQQKMRTRIARRRMQEARTAAEAAIAATKLQAHIRGRLARRAGASPAPQGPATKKPTGIRAMFMAAAGGFGLFRAKKKQPGKPTRVARDTSPSTRHEQAPAADEAAPDSTVTEAYELEAGAAGMLGTRWQDAGTARPERGNELSNPALAGALRRSLEFSKEELLGFEINDLRADSFIGVRKRYYTPVARSPANPTPPPSPPDDEIEESVLSPGLTPRQRNACIAEESSPTPVTARRICVDTRSPPTRANTLALPRAAPLSIPNSTSSPAASVSVPYGLRKAKTQAALPGTTSPEQPSPAPALSANERARRRNSVLGTAKASTSRLSDALRRSADESQPKRKIRDTNMAIIALRAQAENFRSELKWRKSREYVCRQAIAWAFALLVTALALFTALIYALKFKQHAMEQITVAWLMAYLWTFIIVEPFQIFLLAALPCLSDEDTRLGRYVSNCRTVYNELCAP